MVKGKSEIGLTPNFCTQSDKMSELRAISRPIKLYGQFNLIKTKSGIPCQPNIPGSVSDMPGINVVSIKAINMAI